jgi:hypothetical protein
MTQRRKSEKEQKKLADDARLLRVWRKWHREEREAVLVGAHGAALHELFRMLQNLKHVQPVQLIGFAHSIDWSEIDFNTRLVVVHELSAAITAFREKRGLEPIDDNLPGQPDTPFRTIKAIVLTASPHCEGAHRGEARPE